MKSSIAPARPSKPDAAVDFVAGLIAAILAAVNAKVANIRCCEQTNPRTHFHVAAHSGIELPRIVDGGLHEHAANIGTRIKGGFAVFERLTYASTERVPVDGFLFGSIREMS